MECQTKIQHKACQGLGETSEDAKLMQSTQQRFDVGVIWLATQEAPSLAGQQNRFLFLEADPMTSNQ